MLGEGVLRAVLCAKKRRGKDNRGKQHKWVVYSSRGLSCVYRVVVVVACYIYAGLMFPSEKNSTEVSGTK